MCYIYQYFVQINKILSNLNPYISVKKNLPMGRVVCKKEEILNDTETEPNIRLNQSDILIYGLVFFPPLNRKLQLFGYFNYCCIFFR